jgi:WD40 repeat protein/mono/diheme cytochrome c family protein
MTTQIHSLPESPPSSIRARRFTYVGIMLLGTLASIVPSSSVVADEPVAMINYDDHIKPIFREHCVACHEADDKTSGLALDTYAASIEGGSGGSSLASGDPGSSRLFAMVAHTEQPYMPPDEDAIDGAKIALLKTWIQQGMPENSGSKIKKAKVNMAALATTSAGRPEGPPPMPETVLKEPAIYTPRSAAIAALTFSPWSPLLAIGGQEQVSLYNTETFELVGVLPFPEGDPQSITFSRDGSLMLVGGGMHATSGQAVLFDIRTGERITKVGDELDIVMAADISDDNSRIALAGPKKVVRVFDTSTGELVYEQKKHTDWITALRFSPDGVLLASADRANGLVVWEALTGRLYLDLADHKDAIYSIDWRPDSALLFSASKDGTVKMWDMNTGKAVKSIPAHGGGVMSISVCNNGMFATCGLDKLVKLWDSAGNAKGDFAGLPDQALEVALSVDGKWLAAGDWAGNVRVWQAADPANSKILPANPPTIEMRMATATREVTAIAGKLQTLQADLTAKTATTETLTSQLNAANTELTTTTTALAQSNESLTALQSGMQTNSELIQTLKNQLQAAELKQTELVSQIDAEQKKTTELTTLKTTLESTTADLATKIPPLEQAVVTAKTAADAAAAELSAAQSELAAAKADAAELAKAQAELDTKNAQLAADLKTSEDQLATAQTQAQTSQAELDSMTSKISELQKQMADMAAKIEAERALQSKADETVKTHQQSVESLTQKIEQLQQDLQQVTAKKEIFDEAYEK